MNTLLQPVLIAAILIAAIVFILLKTKSQQKAIIFLDKKDKIILTGLMLIYGCLSFINLGQTDTYGSWNGDYQGKYFDINFKVPTQISNIYYYMGMGKGNLAISYSGAYTQGNLVLANDYYRGDYAWYKWLNVTLPDNAEVSKLHVYVNTPDGIELKQLALFDKDKRLITNFTLSSQSNLEQSNLESLFSNTPPKNLHNFLSGMFLDEVFYGQTAYQYLHGITPYAWAHPQLALLIIAVGVWLFGMSPFGWRFFPNISGIMLIGVVYVFAKRVFEDRRAAIIASLLIMFDFMHFTFTRTASIDSIKTLFIAFEYYFLYDYFIKRKEFANNPLIAWRSLLWCGIFFGLAISTKWDALFSVFAILPTLVYAELIKNRPTIEYPLTKIISWQSIILIVIPISIYCLCYIPFYLISAKNGDAYANNSFLSFILKYQQQMLEFHTKGKEGITHPYLSPWWSWPLNMKPDPVWSHQEAGSPLSSSIIMMGNPIFWWALFPALVIAIKQIISARNPKIVFLVLALLSLWLPWSLMGHYTFIYYFYSVTPILALLVTNMLVLALANDAKLGVYFYLAIIIGLFIAFYPGISGMEFDRAYVTGHLSWFSTWRY